MHDYRYDAALLPRLLTGPASGVIIVLGESWITGGAAGSQRATLTGLYASAFTGCQLAGPLLISVGPAADISADSDCRGHRRLPADAAPSAHRHS